MTTNAITPAPDLITTALANDPALQSPHTIRQYAASLRGFEAWRAGRGMTKSLVESYAVSLQRQGLAPATIKQRMSAVLWWARRVLDLADEHDAPKVAKQAARVLSIKVSKIVKGTTPPAGRHMDESELAALLNACHDGTPAGLRDAALFAVSWTTGLRRAELTGLRVEDMERMESDATLTVHGKGGKTRSAYVYNGAYKALVAWMAARGDAPGYIFCPVRKNGKPAPEKSISGEALRKIERKREILAGVEHFSSHDFRRTWVGNLLEDGNDLATVQTLAGHASPVTTSRYDRRPESVRRAAIANIHIPEIGE